MFGEMRKATFGPPLVPRLPPDLAAGQRYIGQALGGHTSTQTHTHTSTSLYKYKYSYSVCMYRH